MLVIVILLESALVLALLSFVVFLIFAIAFVALLYFVLFVFLLLGEFGFKTPLMDYSFDFLMTSIPSKTLSNIE